MQKIYYAQVEILHLIQIFMLDTSLYLHDFALSKKVPITENLTFILLCSFLAVITN